MPSLTNFKLKEKFIIYKSGYISDSNKNYRADGVVLFGRETVKIPALADLYFHTNDK